LSLFYISSFWQETLLAHAINKNIAGKWGWTLKHRQFASLYFGSGLTNNYLALVVIFNKIFSISSCSGQDKQ
jgi:hypothetical protein